METCKADAAQSEMSCRARESAVLRLTQQEKLHRLQNQELEERVCAPEGYRIHAKLVQPPP